MSVRPFRFGVGPAGLTGDVAANAAAWTDLARHVEELGYHSLLVGDHLDGRPGPLTALAVAAATTSRLHVGTSVLNNDLRNAAVLGQEVVTLHRWSGGRIELGLGAGWLSTDYERAGLPMDPPGRRIARLDQAVTALRELLSAEFAGSDAGDGAAPPIVLGGGGRRMLELAARRADIVAINARLSNDSAGLVPGADATVEATRRKLDWVRTASADRAHAPELQIYVHAVRCANDRDEAAAAAAARLGITAAEALQSPHVLAGPSEAMIEQLEARRGELGISYVMVSAGVADAFAPVVAALAGR